MESELLCVTETEADRDVVVEGDEELDPSVVLDTKDDCEGLMLTETEAVVEGLIDGLNEPEVEPDPVSETDAVLVLDRLCDADPVKDPIALCVVDPEGLLVVEPDADSDATAEDE